MHWFGWVFTGSFILGNVVFALWCRRVAKQLNP